MKSESVTIQIKAIEQYFHVVLFFRLIMLYRVVITLSLWIQSLSVIIEMKCTSLFYVQPLHSLKSK